MKRVVVCFLILAVHLTISGATPGPVYGSPAGGAFLPDIGLPPLGEKGPNIAPPAIPIPRTIYHGQSIGGSNSSTASNLDLDGDAKIRYVSGNTNGSDKVTIYGCDGSAWEGSTGVAKGQAELQGTWIGYEENRTGKWSVTFADSGAFEIKGPGNEWYNGKYVCDSNQDPKHLNFYIKQSSNPTHIGETSLIIYKIDRNILTWALNEPGVKTRPGSFVPESGARILVVTKQQ
ncbi:MAG: hypothetical protein WAW37_10770 [Syntrophobacteraceae bacterium]